MILTLQLYSPSVTDKIPSDLLPATSRPSFCSEIHAEICVFKKEKKKANNPPTPRPELALRINYLCLQPQKLLRLQGFSRERACTEGCKASTLPDQGQLEHTREWLCFAFPFLLLVLTHAKSSLPLWDFSFFDTSTLAYGKMLLSNVIQTCQGTHEAKRMLTLFMNMWFVFIHMLVNKKKKNCFQEIKTHLN